MAAKIKDNCDIETSLIPGSGGEFELVVDGSLLYSKRQTGSFPDAEEIVKRISNLT